jgi:hypothetical protein
MNYLFHVTLLINLLKIGILKNSNNKSDSIGLKNLKDDDSKELDEIYLLQNFRRKFFRPNKFLQNFRNIKILINSS